MPKIICHCGETINLSSIPNAQGYKIISELVLEKLVESLRKAHLQSESEEDFVRCAYEEFHLGTPGIVQAYECSRCGRLALFAKASASVPDLWLTVEQARNPSANTLRLLIAETIAANGDQ